MGGGRDADARVVAEHVDLAEAFDREIGEGLHLAVVRHVTAGAHHLHPGIGQLGYGGVSGLVVQVGYHQVHACPGERPGHTEPDATRSSGDHGHPTLEALHCRPFARTRPGRTLFGARLSFAVVRAKGQTRAEPAALLGLGLQEGETTAAAVVDDGRGADARDRLGPLATIRLRSWPCRSPRPHHRSGSRRPSGSAPVPASRRASP